MTSTSSPSRSSKDSITYHDDDSNQKYGYTPPSGALLLLTLLLLALCFACWASMSPVSPTPQLLPSTMHPLRQEVAALLQQAENLTPDIKSSSTKTREQQQQQSKSPIDSSDASTSPVTSVVEAPTNVLPQRIAIVTLLASTISPSGERRDSPTVDSFLLFTATLLEHVTPAVTAAASRGRNKQPTHFVVLLTNDFDPAQARRVETFAAEYAYTHLPLEVRRVAAVTPPKGTLGISSPAQLSVVSQLLSKLQLWSLFAYSQLLYVDVTSVFVQNPFYLFDLCTTPLCASPLPPPPTAQGMEYSTGLLLLEPSSELHSYLLDAVDALGRGGGSSENNVQSQAVASLFPTHWTSLGPAPLLMLLPLPQGSSSSAEDEVPDFSVPHHVVCVGGTLPGLFEHYRHPNLPWNQPMHSNLVARLPSLAAILEKRRQKQSRMKSRHSRLRKQSRSSRLGQ